MKLRGKILLAFLVAALPLAAIDAWWIVRGQRAEHAQVMDRLRSEAEHASAHLDLFFRDLAARGQQTAREVLRGDGLEAYLHGRLADLRQWNAGIKGLAWVGADGRLVATYPADFFGPSASMAERTFFQARGGRQAWALGDLEVEQVDGRPVPLVRMLAQDADGRIRGTVMIGLGPETLQPLFPSGAYWAAIRLADRTGRLVYATDLAEPTWNERQRWADVAGVRDALLGGSATNPEVHLPGAAEATEWMAAHVVVPETGWVASAVIPMPDATAASRNDLHKELATHGLLLILCVGAALILAHLVASPARRLAGAAHRIAGGDRAARVGLTGRDELAAAGRAFDQMAEAVDASWQALTAQRDAAEELAVRLATLTRLANLVSSSLNPGQVFDFVAEATSRLLDGTAALLLVADETGEAVSIRASHGVGHPTLRTLDRFRAGEGLAGWVFQRHEPLVLHDMLEDARILNRAWIEAEGLHAFAGIPLMVRDRCLGVLCAVRRGRQPFGGPDVDLLTAFAAHAATAIHNARLYTQSEAGRERLQAFMEAMPEAVSIGEAGVAPGEIRLVLGNRVRAALLRTTELVPGARTPYYEFVRPDGSPMAETELPLQRAIWRAETIRGLEMAVRFPDGAQRFVLANGKPLQGPGDARQAVVVFQDITERKLAEEALRASEARYRVLVDLAGLVSSTLDPGRLFISVAEATSRLLDGAAALLFVADPGGESVAICAVHGLRHPGLRTQNRFHAGEGLPGTVLQTKKPLILEDVLGDARALNRAWLEAEGLRAFVGVPLLFRDRCLGVLFAARGGDRPFAQPDVDLLMAFGAHAATAIENAGLYERADAERERLRALVEAMPEAVVVGEAGPGETDIRLVLANHAFRELLRAPELVAGARTPYYQFLRPDGTPLDNEELALERALSRGEPTRGMELAVRFPDGRQRYVLENAAPLPETPGGRQAVAVLQDITERKRGEEELKRLAEEIATLYEQAARDAQMKGLLLEELTHRVRNNLAVIVSFLELQREGAKEVDVEAVVEDAIARVEGLALVHNVLAAAGFQAGEFGALARGLAEQILQQGPLADRVVVCVEGPALPLPSAQLTTLGLVTNELFTNIAKHAFPDGRRGRVDVTVGSAGPEATVRVRDDGVGLPPGFAEQPGHLGLKLIRSMVELTLRGTFALETGEGTTALIRFPVADAARPGRQGSTSFPEGSR